MKRDRSIYSLKPPPPGIDPDFIFHYFNHLTPYFLPFPLFSLVLVSAAIFLVLRHLLLLHLVLLVLLFPHIPIIQSPHAIFIYHGIPFPPLKSMSVRRSSTPPYIKPTLPCNIDDLFWHIFPFSSHLTPWFFFFCLFIPPLKCLLVQCSSSSQSIKSPSPSTDGFLFRVPFFHSSHTMFIFLPFPSLFKAGVSTVFFLVPVVISFSFLVTHFFLSSQVYSLHRR